MLDAFGKPGPGILDGNILMWLGSFDECLAVTPLNVIDKANSESPFGTHYCLAYVPLPAGLAGQGNVIIFI